VNATINGALDGPGAETPPRNRDAGTSKAEANRRIEVGADASKAIERKLLLRPFLLAALPPVLGIALLVLVWEIVSVKNSSLPSPWMTFNEAVNIFSDPFYQKGPNNQGIGWNILASLKRVAVGFGLAAAVGIPLGFMIGRFKFLAGMFNPIVGLLKPVSPLAWLPIGLLLFKAANPAAIWAISICSIWPMIINTAVGVQRVPQDYMNVARVLNLSEWKILTKILSHRCCLTC